MDGHNQEEELKGTDATPGAAVVVGGAVTDLVASAAQGRPLLPRTSSPGQLVLSAGGVGRNIAEGLARLGEPPLFLSAVGDDALGDRWLPPPPRGSLL